MRWNKLKESKWILVVLISFLLMGCVNTAVAGNEIKATAVPKEPVQPGKKILKDGQVLIRHAGDEWSRQKIRKYLAENALNLELGPGTSTQVPDNLCTVIEEDLHALNFEFIKPDIVTDDWEDPRLNKYKQKYDKFKYGMGYLENYGPDNATLPTWNINIYEVDTDKDGVIETILYGERLWARLKSGKAYAGYRVFEPHAEWMRGGGYSLW